MSAKQKTEAQQPETERLLAELTKQSRAKLVAAAIAGSTLILGFAGYGVWATFQPQIKNYIRQTAGTDDGAFKIPAGAVVAFDLSDGCPSEGWKEFTDARGRTIIGAGKGEGLTPRAFREPLGVESFKLAPDQLPEHSHPINALVIDKSTGGVVGFKEGGWFANRVLAIPRKDASEPGFPIESVGRNQQTLPKIISVTGAQKDINNMQPYIALLYCEKL